MTSIIGFMNAAVGRALRFVLGVVLIAYGLLVLGGTAGTVVAIIGLLPIALALWGRCLPARRRPHHRRYVHPRQPQSAVTVFVDRSAIA